MLEANPSAAPAFSIASPGDLPYVADEIRRAVTERNVAWVRGLVAPEECSQALAHLAARFDPGADSPVDHKSRAPEPLAIPNYQRLMIGEWGEAETQHSFWMRLFYNPLWNADHYGLQSAFRRLVRLRNLVQGTREDYCLDGPESGIYTLSRIHQYPAGGGFLGSHRDSVAAQVPITGGLADYFQVLLVMSRKGADFTRGGGYWVQGGKRVLYEDFCEPGDVLIYNSQTLHGVACVDPHTPPDLASLTGRYSATVTLYRQRRGPMSMG